MILLRRLYFSLALVSALFLLVSLLPIDVI